jgi:hypothetical protein
MYDYGARYYDPQSGRFLNQDPAGEGTNPYSYVFNDPLDLSDPTGMSAWGGMSMNNEYGSGGSAWSIADIARLSQSLSQPPAQSDPLGDGGAQGPLIGLPPIDRLLSSEPIQFHRTYEDWLDTLAGFVGIDQESQQIVHPQWIQNTVYVSRAAAAVTLGTAATIVTGGAIAPYLGGGMLGAVGTGAVGGGAGAFVSNAVWQSTGSEQFSYSQLAMATATGFAAGGVLGGMAHILSTAGGHFAQYISNLMNPPAALASNGGVVAGAAPTVTSGVIAGPGPGWAGMLIGDLTSFFRNIHGQNGAPDHVATVERLKIRARKEFPGMDVRSNESIRKLTGINRRPDVWVRDPKTGKILKVYEAARQNADGSWVSREGTKQAEYRAAGIPSHFEPVTP